ncbi:related to P.aeruginosa anthranilate synthase component II [Fusarium torulosum]|uniref:Related to P.aeruginosa anthranilate synthase component II n=1 Tax=Fusarium torulosum TaxID=33205 RepID=A0AAE8M9Q7_9HYPO|nr:related to P.aeruginosa anthranilate synthase component II [Fusarium torulosum]
MAHQNFRVAILQNFILEETGGRPMIDRISNLIIQSNSNAEITIHAPIQGDEFPDLDSHDLIILTGGPFNLLQDNKPSWVTETLNFIEAATSRQAKLKILGICWGQQAIALALGGSLEKSKRGHCIGVETIALNSDGALFFNAKSLNIHKNHEIAVADIGPHLSCLAPNNEVLLSKDNHILTFQGHPEMDADLSRLFVTTDDKSPSPRPELSTNLRPIDTPHDGEVIFAAVMKWASENVALR